MDPNLSRLRSLYGRPRAARQRGKQPDWPFTGKQWTERGSNGSNRTQEAARGAQGVGVVPRVWPDSDPRISEVPVLSRASLRYATTALAQQGGIIPREQVVDRDLLELKRNPVRWVQHDPKRSTCDSKVLRPFKVAGVNSARLGWLSAHSATRQGIDDRPPGMREDETLPGGFLFSPSEAHGDPTRFGRDTHFTSGFANLQRARTR
mmetsp:Transcript_49313/g.107357  ORF Transcript_49313/g.107357 Transcript_49313/m.107357 type:complete len:206 (-) Transcript_49313:97-714(-)